VFSTPREGARWRKMLGFFQQGKGPKQHHFGEVLGARSHLLLPHLAIAFAT